MAEITITIKDLPNGNVTVVATPSFEEMAQMINAGIPATSAHGYALHAINAIRMVSREAGPTPMLIPRVRS